MPKDTVLITGNTFPVKDALRAMGGVWDATEKGWMVPVARESEAKALVSGNSATQSKKPFRHYRCTRCGRKPGISGWPRIYRNGLCSDCYSDDQED